MIGIKENVLERLFKSRKSAFLIHGNYAKVAIDMTLEEVEKVLKNNTQLADFYVEGIMKIFKEKHDR